MILDLAACSDGELAGLTLGGNRSAFAAIMQRHRDPIYRLIRSYIGDGEEALDVTQETFASAFHKLARFDPQRSMRAWLAGIAVNKSRDWRRRQRVRRILSFGASLPPGAITDFGDETAGPDKLAADREQLARVSMAVAELPARLKETLLLRTIEGLSQAETAAALSISEKAVETRLYRARKQLTQKLSAF